jgi:hypothetical protein
MPSKSQATHYREEQTIPVPTVLVATPAGCRVFTPGGAQETELGCRSVTALAAGLGKTCWAVVEEHEVWQRSAEAEWSLVTSTNTALESILAVGDTVFGGSSANATVVRLPSRGGEVRLAGFDKVAGREAWFASGPPLSVRALTATVDGTVLLAAVHVGGIPRSSDGGLTWLPTLPIEFDVHEVRAHPNLPALAAAATAVGLCISRDAGLTWEVLDEGLDITDSLAVAVLPDEALFSVQDGPFAARSQVWRWALEASGLEQVRDGLPLWLEGKVDTAHIATCDGRAAIADGGGNLWLSGAGSRGWERIAAEVPCSPGILML